MMETGETSLLSRLKIGGKLPAPQGVALEVINLTQREDASNHDITRLVGADPVLSARVIKAANILLSNPSRPITTVGDAVTVLGARALRQLVLGISLIADYRHGPCERFDYPGFWRRSLLTGIAARHLAAHTRLAASEEMFVLGLLGNIGELALVTAWPQEYGELLAQAQDKTLAELFRLERERFDCDQAELGEAVLADMHFPVIFQMLVRDFRLPEQSRAVEGSREWRLLYLLHVAALMAETWLADDGGQTGRLARLRMQAARAGLEESVLTAVGEDCAGDWTEWSALLNLGAWRLPSFAEMLQRQEEDIADIEVPQWPYADATQYRMRVLAAAGERATLALLESLLKAAGHEVVTAGEGADAWGLIEQVHPQLVIVDRVLPGSDALTLCRKLREKPKWRATYVIVLGTQAQPEAQIEAFEAGADDYLSRPLVQKLFFARLHAARRVVQLQEELAFDREQLVRFSRELTASNERLQRLALTDALTGLPNRRYAIERLDQEWALSQRGERALSCMMVDIDHFKAINDRFGHQVGDEALKLVATTLRSSARTQDVVCRYGGEEFVVVCPDTALDAACQCAERLRLNVAALNLKEQGVVIPLTVSIGIAEKTPDIAQLEDLLIRADECLYVAKQNGRNRSECRSELC